MLGNGVRTSYALMANGIPASKFLFVLVQPQATGWLKAEIAREHPELSLAFSRPGLVTFKHRAEGFTEAFRPKSVFVRHYGFSLGQASTLEQLGPLLLVFTARLRLHVYARDEGESRPMASPDELRAIRDEILQALPDRFYDDPNPKSGDTVIDVIVPPPSENREPWFVGWHRHRAAQSPWPGAVSRLQAPPQAPSRAWCKLEELIHWSSLPLKAGQCAVEIGCAPGGAVLSLLDRGLQVIGIDPGAIEPAVIEHAKTCSGSFTHLACPVGAVKREQLPKHVDWLLCDANLAPTVTLRYLAHWSKQLRPQLRGIIFTLKLNDERMLAQIPKLLARCGELGFGPARGIQLPSHRQEIAVLCTKATSLGSPGANEQR